MYVGYYTLKYSLNEIFNFLISPKDVLARWNLSLVERLKLDIILYLPPFLNTYSMIVLQKCIHFLSVYWLTHLLVFSLVLKWCTLKSNMFSTEALFKIILLFFTCEFSSGIFWLFFFPKDFAEVHTLKKAGNSSCLFHIKSILQPLVWVRNTYALVLDLVEFHLFLAHA